MAIVREPNETQVRLLLQRIGQRDEAALTELHRLYSRRIFAFALHRLGDHYEAETVVADTLFDVWKSPTKFRGESKLSTWILGIAHYKVLSTLRARGDGHANLDDFEEVLESPEPCPAVQLETHQAQVAIKGCMDRLSPAHRECLQLVFYEGMSLAEVAQVQAVPENTIKTRLFHARKNMRTCLSRYELETI